MSAPTIEVSGHVVTLSNTEFARIYTSRYNVKILEGTMLSGDPQLCSAYNDSSKISWEVKNSGPYSIAAFSIAPNKMVPVRTKVIFDIVIEKTRKEMIEEAANNLIAASAQLNVAVAILNSMNLTTEEVMGAFSFAELKSMGFYGPTYPINWITISPYPPFLGKMKNVAKATGT